MPSLVGSEMCIRDRFMRADEESESELSSLLSSRRRDGAGVLSRDGGACCSAGCRRDEGLREGGGRSTTRGRDDSSVRRRFVAGGLVCRGLRSPLDRLSIHACTCWSTAFHLTFQSEGGGADAAERCHMFLLIWASLMLWYTSSPPSLPSSIMVLWWSM